MTEPEATLAQRLEAARTRSNDLAANASGRARDFIHDHPLASVAGGIALGALIAGLIASRSPRKAATPAPARISRLAALGAELALGYAARAIHAGKDGVDQIGETGTQAGRRVADFGEIALTTLRQAINRMTHPYDKSE